MMEWLWTELIRAIVNTVMNEFHKLLGISWVAEQLEAYQEGLVSIELISQLWFTYQEFIMYHKYLRLNFVIMVNRSVLTGAASDKLT